MSTLRLGLGLLALSGFAWVIVKQHRALAERLGITLMALALTAYGYVNVARNALREAREWDFLCFWVWGRMAALGLDFYDPASGAAFAAGRSDEFRVEILNVGLWYPPQTALLLTPLGWFEPLTAQWLWLSVQVAAFAGSAALAFRLFAPSRDWVTGLAVVGFLFALPGARETLAHAQTHGLGLLLSLLVLKDRSRPIAGLWVALAAVVKPMFGLWLLYLLLVKNRRGALVTLGASAAIAGVAGAAFGLEKLATYVFDSPMSRAPAFVYSEGVNQSLSATFLRAFGLESAPRSLAARLPVAGLSLLVAGATVPALLRTRERDPVLAAAILLTVVLVVYPFSLAHYTVLLMPFLLVTLVAGPPWRAAAVVLAAFATGWKHGQHVFFVHLALLALFTRAGSTAAAPARH